VTKPALISIVTGLLFVGLVACDPASSPQGTDSQTNWLQSCEIDAQCGSLECVCGVCTRRCAEDATCADLQGAACIATAEAGAIAQCGGSAPSTGLCLPRCEGTCAEGQMCVAGVCTPVLEPTATVTVDTAARRQELVGFGATVAYGESEITRHAEREALYSAMFSELGLDVLRLRNRHGTGDDLQESRELVAAAAANLGRVPTVLLTLWSPPSALKASGARYCDGNFDTCTLARTADGEFDYAGFAAHWRASLEAYAAAGIQPDYIGLQNNPDWVPSDSSLGEACRFLPAEGTATISTGGARVTVEYPGLAEAQAATLDALQGLPTLPRILAPETSDHRSVGEYLDALDLDDVGALAHHLYGSNPMAPDVDGLGEVGALASQLEKPIFQTEMVADGLGTAVLIHHTVASEDASAYLFQTLTSSAQGPAANPFAPIGLAADSFTLREPYFAMRHYARHTDPGWARVEARSSADALLVTAWLSPEQDALTVVLVNAGDETLQVRLDAPFNAPARVTRTVFDGVERGTGLGALAAQRLLTIPPRAVVTVAFGG